MGSAEMVTNNYSYEAINWINEETLLNATNLNAMSAAISTLMKAIFSEGFVQIKYPSVGIAKRLETLDDAVSQLGDINNLIENAEGAIGEAVQAYLSNPSNSAIISAVYMDDGVADSSSSVLSKYIINN